MSRIIGRVAIVFGSSAAVGCFPSFSGLSGGASEDGATDVQQEPTGCTDETCDHDAALSCGDAAGLCSDAGDAADALCDGQPCPSPAGTALRFSGKQLVRVAPGPSDDFTIEMWLKTKQYVDTDQWYNGGALFQADTPGPTNDYGASVVGDKFALGNGKPDVTAVSRTSINTGAWFHVAGTRVKSTGVIRIFVNGVLETILTTGNTNSLTDSPPPWIGGIANGSKVESSFIGDMDELRVWNIARTGEELTSTMHSRLRGDESGLIGYWRFDDGSGLTASDSSPSRNDGSLGYGLPELAPEWVPSDAPISP